MRMKDKIKELLDKNCQQRDKKLHGKLYCEGIISRDCWRCKENDELANELASLTEKD